MFVKQIIKISMNRGYGWNILSRVITTMTCSGEAQEWVILDPDGVLFQEETIKKNVSKLK